jgi:hypothetical protein
MIATGLLAAARSGRTIKGGSSECFAFGAQVRGVVAQTLRHQPPPIGGLTLLAVLF